MFGFNKKSNESAMNNAEKFRHHGKKTLQSLATFYGGQCIVAAGIGGIEGAIGDKKLTKAMTGVTMAGGAVMVAGSVGTLYHGYKTTAAAIDCTADRMSKLYEEDEEN